LEGVSQHRRRAGLPDVVAAREGWARCRGERNRTTPESPIRAGFVPDSFL